MSHQAKEEYLESSRVRYPGGNCAGKSAMIDEVIDTLGWDRKHTIKALNGKVSLGRKVRKRGSKPIYIESEKTVVVEIWTRSEQPCGKRLKTSLPLWLRAMKNAMANSLRKCIPRFWYAVLASSTALQPRIGLVRVYAMVVAPS